MPIMKSRKGTFDLLEDVGGFGGPYEGLGVLVVTVDIFVDSCDQFLDAAKDPAAQAVLGQIAEEALHHIQPGAAGRREVDVKTGVALQPSLDLGIFVGGVVVHDHMDLLALRDHIIDAAQKLQPFLMAMPVVAHREHLTFERIQGRKERGGALRF